MVLTPQVTLRDMPPSLAMETHIYDKINKLNKFYTRIVGCRVVLEPAEKSHHQGNMYTASIDLTVPGEELVINKVKDEDAYVVIRDAFRAARRKLQEYAQRQRGYVKAHEQIRHGTIGRIYKDLGYGFIQSNGDEYYFSNANAMHPEFETLEIGMTVVFTESFAGDGLQANRVTVGKHGTLQ
ncbi:HPF/RaiA family ribosome-associated protein [soil metagenome]